MTPWRTWRQEVGAHCTGRGPGLTTSCPLTCFLLGPLHLPADDFLEPKEYAESGEAADLGRSRTGPGVGGRGPTAHGCPSSRSRGRAGDPELRGAGPKECGRPGSQWAGVWVGGPQQKAAAPVLPQELFITTSQKFVQETELGQRVREWEDTIQPLLQEQVRGRQVASLCPQGPAIQACLGTTPFPLAGAARAL